MWQASCDQVAQWLRLAQTGRSAELPVALPAHLSACAQCSRALCQATLERLDIPHDAAGSCACCQNDLAAYIDCERAEGVVLANQQYLHVWWHLLFCETCYETYHLTQALLTASYTGELSALPFNVPVGEGEVVSSQ